MFIYTLIWLPLCVHYIFHIVSLASLALTFSSIPLSHLSLAYHFSTTLDSFLSSFPKPFSSLTTLQPSIMFIPRILSSIMMISNGTIILFLFILPPNPSPPTHTMLSLLFNLVLRGASLNFHEQSYSRFTSYLADAKEKYYP